MNKPDYPPPKRRKQKSNVEPVVESSNIKPTIGPAPNPGGPSQGPKTQ